MLPKVELIMYLPSKSYFSVKCLIVSLKAIYREQQMIILLKVNITQKRSNREKHQFVMVYYFSDPIDE